MKYLFLVLLLVGCTKSPIPDESEQIFEVQVGICYRYPNRDMNDVHIKVTRKYDKGGFLAEFIVEKQYFTDVHEFNPGFDKVKEIDCELYSDLRSLSTEWNPQNGES